MTIEQLQAMSNDELSNLATIPLTIQPFTEMTDDELNKLAAKLRGWTLENGRYREEDGSRSTSEMRLDRWTPATSRDQSGELLEFAESKDLGFMIDRRGQYMPQRIVCYGSDHRWLYEIPGNDARAETIAFCAAMLAIQGEANGQL